MTWTRLMRWAGITCLLIVLLLSLLPGVYMRRTSMGQEMEHVVAYLGATFVFASGWRDYGIRYSVGILLFFVALGGAMELFQHYSPGRAPRWIDFWASAAGAVIGVILSEVAYRVLGFGGHPRRGHRENISKHRL